jgi:alpha-D-ribose 1-methylphosphonate 5-triphosphate synthase subunit PhnH
MMTATDSLSGGFADPATDAARAFRAVLDAMARPGRILRLAGAAAPAPAGPALAAALLTLADGTTPVHLAGDHDTPALRDWLRFHTGAPLAGRGAAVFAVGSWPALLPLQDYAPGTPEYPDRSATLIVALDRLEPSGARLTGPGILTEARLSLPDLAPLHWNAARFPLGLDLILTCGDRLAALPRTTRVEAG